MAAETLLPKLEGDSMICVASWLLSHIQNNQLHKVDLVPKLFGLCSSTNIWVQHDS